MSKFISRSNPISSKALKRRPLGTVAEHYNGRWDDVFFTRVHGGWRRERLDLTGTWPEVVTSAAVAAECNRAFGCEESWARIY